MEAHWLTFFVSVLLAGAFARPSTGFVRLQGCTRQRMVDHIDVSFDVDTLHVLGGGMKRSEQLR